ncbi:MAG: tetratricopeptide repeat protein [Bacteroidetes bacterium]|nr:tetratricopeptide repeat protein [Bacteroidota bacterium]
MKKLVLILCTFISCGLSANANIEVLKDSAESFYRQGKYEQSTEKWEAILKEDFHSPELYAALGNAYYKQNKIGLAILNYERALKLAPGDADVKDNLELANSKKTDKALSSSPNLKEPLTELSAIITYDQLSWIAIFLMLTAGAIIIFTRFRAKENRKMGFLTGLGLNLLAIVLILFAAFQKKNTDDILAAIVTSPSAQIYNEPSSSSTRVVTLHEGSKVVIAKTEGDWLKVLINEEFSGWVVKSSVEEI